ncbi:MAG: beta-ketoacyl-ACP synthase II [SAR202 cluster bacterium]|nr:beta-ketoacyl-ACP synthase II [SAR202 cluster bacterium]
MKPRVVVTGIGMVSPVGLTRDSSWKNLVSGVSGIDHISAFNPEDLETTIAGEVDGFDPTEHMTLKESKRMDRFAQFAVAASWEAVNHAGLDINNGKGERVSVMIASGIGGIITLENQIGILNERGPRRVSPFLVPMMLPDMASGQVSMALGAKGPNFATVSACASGGDSIGQAFELLQSGGADVVVAGGSEAAISPIGVAGFNSVKALSRHNHEPTKASRPFDANRDGFILGEGAGVLILEEREHAMDRGANPIVEMVGYGSSSDAYHITQPHPEGEGGARAMATALETAHLSPADIDYVNAHGTSTPLNDKAETLAMKRVFGDEAYKIPVSSTKSMVGHLLGASGALEAAISVMAISKGVAPPTINLEEPDIDCDLDYIPHVARRGRIRSAMSNSFGFGGHNASLIFQEYTD